MWHATRRFGILLAALSLGGICAAAACGRDGRAQGEPIRVLVDCTYAARTPGHELAPEYFTLARDVGFNAICPLWGVDDDERIRRDAALAGEAGLAHLCWMHGTLGAPAGDPWRLAWENGSVQSIYGPNAPALWERFRDRILTLARLSKGSALAGVFLDFEIYAPGGRGNGYPLSYDPPTLQAFGATQGVAIPDLPPGERKPWLDARGLHEAFERWQRAGWRDRARRLRAQVDAINADFLFVVYPYPDTPFLHEIIPLWGTPHAPAVIASAITYHGRLPLVDERAALAMRAGEVGREVAALKARGFPFLYIGGMDPVVRGADPEFCAKSASMLGKRANGYWLFYEGLNADSLDADRYMAWFSKANHDIATGCFRLPGVAQRTALPASVERAAGQRPVAITGTKRDVLFRVFGEAGDFSPHLLAGDTLEHLRQFDLLVVQDLRLPRQTHPAVHRLLRAYVEQGGGLMLVHKTLPGLGMAFPEIAAGIAEPPSGAPTFRGLTEHATMTVSDGLLTGFAPGERFDFSWPLHFDLRPGPRGRVVLRSAYDAPTVIVSEHGRGRVAVVGPHLGIGKEPTPRQREFTLALGRWLVDR